MQLYELFESAPLDVEESMWAEKARRALVRQYQNGYSRAAITGLKTGDPKIDDILRVITFKFAPGAGDGVFDPSPYGEGGTLTCFVKNKDAASIISFLESQRGASTFRHEFQHAIDHDKPAKLKTPTYSPAAAEAGDREHIIRYINSDSEFSAFCKELAEPLLQVLRAAKENDAETLQHARIEPDFRKYITQQYHLELGAEHRNIMKLMTNGYRIRLYKRLAALHKAAIAVSGVGKPFNPTLKQKVFLWLNKTLENIK